MKLERQLIAPRTYMDQFGRFWSRPTINRRRTWRLIVDNNDVPVKRKAVAVAQSLNTDWRPNTENFSSLADLYVDAKCPTRKQKFKQPSPDFIADETRNATKLKEFFGKCPVSEVNDLLQIPLYSKWRLKQFDKGKGTRAVDKEVQTLSNIINYAVFGTKQERLNFIMSNRPRYHVVKSSSRARMPESADVIHQIADYFFTASQTDGRALRSEVLGWMTLFQMFMGTRTSELRRMRLDAKPEQAGAIVNGWLHLGRRSKSGINPYAEIYPEFGQMLECFKRWHEDRFPDSQEYFPGPTGEVVDETAHVKAMTRACVKLGVPHCTPHGLRSYCATKHLRDGKNHAEVAAIIGDKTASLIGSTYGDAPGGAKLFWTPRQGLPAWSLYQPEAAKIARIA